MTLAAPIIDRTNCLAASADAAGSPSIRAVAERYARLREGCARLVEGLQEARVPASLRRYPPGALLYSGSWDRRALRVLREGVATMHASRPGGGWRIVRPVGPWEPFGGTYLPLAPRREGWAEATTGCDVLEFSGGSMAMALRRRPDLALWLATLLEFELAEKQDLLEVLLPRRTEHRLARLLILLAGKFGGGPEAEPPLRIDLRPTHTDLAAMVAATRESVTAALRRMRRGGLIEASQQRIVLLDPEGLARHSG